MRSLTVGLRRALTLGLALAAAAIPLAAQTATGNLRGFVRTATGTPVVNATIAARNIAITATRGAVTNEAGYYYIGGLRPGRYEVTVRRIGFAHETRAVQV